MHVKSIRNKLRLGAILAIASMLLVQPGWAATPTPTPTSDNYIVTFKSNTNVDTEANDYRSKSGEVKSTYSRLFKGMTVRANASELDRLRLDSNVLAIEKDSIVTASATQTPTLSWGIDRVDQRSLPLDSSYNFSSDGTGVKVFVVDTGVLATHTDLAGRVDAGYSVITTDNLGTSDGNGHGTHVSGTIAGTDYGLAKAAHIVPVRVLDASGSGTTSGVIAGLNWIGTQIQQNVTKAVVNMSLGGGKSAALNAAVEALVTLGVPVAVAAGNSAANACNSSPSSATNAITVGATDSSDKFATYSNSGSCVDILAPGSSITSDWNTSTTAHATASGTSMATPHVAGAIALLLQAGYQSPAQLVATLKTNAVSNVITGVPSGTPNQLLYTGAAQGTPPTPVTPPITPVTAAPGAPTSLAATATGNRNATVTWFAGPLNGASATASSTYQNVKIYRVANGTPTLLGTYRLSGTAISTNFSRLTIGTQYSFTVTLITQYGTSPASAQSNTITAR
jgi:subtilisin family serine protease